MVTIYKYYQLVTLDGKDTPRFYYRQNGAQDEVWSPTKNTWVPTTTLTRMLINSEPALDMIDHDPTVGLKEGDE
jgi:hypothetical protein